MRMMFGTMYHIISEATDRQRMGEQTGPISALDEYVDSVRSSRSYIYQDSKMVDMLVEETHKYLIPGYADFVQGKGAKEQRDDLKQAFKHLLDIRPDRAQTEYLEEKIYADLGNIILKCIPDRVVRVDGELWGVERKLTGRDDQQWHRKWTANHQTTCEVLAIEAAFKEPCQGILLEQVVVTRKRSKNWPHSDLLQPIHRVEFPQWRAVPKSEFVREECVRFLEDAVAEREWRKKDPRLAESPNPANCSDCEGYDICIRKQDPRDYLVERDNG
jgi:hypothetical protein